MTRADAAGAGDVGPAAEIEKLPLPIEGERWVLGEAGLDVLNFQGLLEVTDDRHGLVAVDLHPLEGFVGLDDLPHLLFDPRQVIVGDRPLEPACRSRSRSPTVGPKASSTPVKKPHHSPGHHMRRRVPHHRQSPRVARLEKLKRHVALRQHRIEAHRLACEHRRNRREFSLTLGHIHNTVGQPRSHGVVSGRSIVKTDGGHQGFLQRSASTGETAGFAAVRKYPNHVAGEQGRDSQPHRSLRSCGPRSPRIALQLAKHASSQPRIAGERRQAPRCFQRVHREGTLERSRFSLSAHFSSHGVASMSGTTNGRAKPSLTAYEREQVSSRSPSGRAPSRAG